MKKVAIGFLGTTLDAGIGEKRWNKWRPTIDMCRQPDLSIDRLELIYDAKFTTMAVQVADDVREVSPQTEVRLQEINIADPWNLVEVYGALHDFCHEYPFDEEHEEYYAHITTGTHVAQICLYLLTESNRLPGKLLQTAVPLRDKPGKAERQAQKSVADDAQIPRLEPGKVTVLDLELEQYDQIASRFAQESNQAVHFLKSGIATKNAAYNRLIERIEEVALRSKAPLLLLGPTGAGKNHLAKRIFQLKQSRRLVKGEFVEVNCATLRGDGAMSALFGHRKGAFTGASHDRSGLLSVANGGCLFLDEIGELGADEQAMLLRALEEKQFRPVGSDKEVKSDFQLIAGTNRDLSKDVKEGRFREDLLARIDLWTFRLPALSERKEDIEPNLDYELERIAGRSGRLVRFNKEARQKFLSFATGPRGLWLANFRDLGAALERMATLAPGGRITVADVEEEIERLTRAWGGKVGSSKASESARLIESLLSPEMYESLDRFDLVQLSDVIEVCRQCASMAEAGRILFAKSRVSRSKQNDADRLRKYLDRLGLDFKSIKGM